MKRLLAALLLSGSLLIDTGTASAGAAPNYGGSQVVLSTRGDNTILSSVTGLGWSAKGGKDGLPTPVDLRFPLGGKSAGFSRTLGYLSGKATSMDATLKLLNQNFEVKQLIDLGDASILEVELPGASATDGKLKAEIRMRLQPQSFAIRAGSGTAESSGGSKAKTINRANFRLSVDGEVMTNVGSVSPCIIRRNGKDLEITGLGVTVRPDQAYDGSWSKWTQQTLAETEQRVERSVTLEYLDATLATTLATVEFTGVTLTAMEVSELASVGAAPAVTFRMSASGVTVR